MEFQQWLLQKYLDWQAEQGKPMTETKFAQYLGVRQQSLSGWLRGYYKPNGYKAINALVAKLGPEVYTLLDAEEPLPPELEEVANRMAKMVAVMPESYRSVVYEAIEQMIEEKFWEDPDNVELRYLTLLQEIAAKKEKEEEEKERFG